MVKLKKSIEIEPEREYGLTEIQQMGIMPGMANIESIRAIVNRDRKGENMLKARIGGEGRLRRYKVKGKHLQKFLEKYGPGMSIRGRK